MPDKAGGCQATQRFARVFQLPTGSHGQASNGAVYKLNILPQLVNWVEKRQAPAQLTAWQTDSSGAVTRTYPAYPLPAAARYSGTGNVDDAANWPPATTVGDLHFHWLGDPGLAPCPYRRWPFAATPSHR